MKQAFRASLVVLGLASLVGCGDSTSPEPRPQGSETSTVEDAVAEPEAFVIRGRVVDPWSDPFAGARVLVRSTREADGPAAEAQSGSDGRFTLEVPRPGDWVVSARDDGMGVARTELRLEASQPAVDLGDLRLLGEGVLAGRLLARDGAPIVDMQVLAYSRDLLRQELFLGNESFDFEALPLWAPETQGVNFVPGQGFHKGSAMTRTDGSFRIEGLAPGSYLLHSRAVGPAAWLDPGRDWYETGDLAIELRSELCRLEVGLEDDEVGGVGSRRLGPLEVFPTVPTSDGDVAAVLALSTTARGMDQNVHWVEPGAYVVKATTYPPRGVPGSSRVDEGLVRVAAADARKTFQLHAPVGELPTGRARITVRAPEGFSPPAGYHLRTGWTSTALQHSNPGNHPAAMFGDWLELPEGRHLAGLTPRVDLPGRADALELGEAFVQVQVVAGEDASAELVLSRGGSVQVTLEADRFSLGRDLVAPEDLLAGERKQILSTFALTVGATLALQRDGAGPLQELRWRDALARLGEERKVVLPGETVETYELIAAGEYTLWVLSPAFERASLPVTVRPGEVSEVTVRLKPR